MCRRINHARMDPLYGKVLQYALGGGGKRKTTGKKTAAAQQQKLKGAGVPIDIDVLMQQFNHTGTVALPESMTPQMVTQDVVAPAVRQILHVHFPHAQGHRLTEVIQQRGYTVPPSLESAKSELEQFRSTAQDIRKNWEAGLYTTVDALVAGSPNSSLMMELFACVGMLMDSYSQLNAKDLALVLPALFACSLVLRESMAEKTLEQWKANPYAHGHLDAVDRLKRETKRIQSSQGQTMRGGGEATSSPLDMSRNLLALNTALMHKRQLLAGYTQAVGHGPAPAANGSMPPTSLASSILGAAAPVVQAPAPAPAAAPAPASAPAPAPAPAAPAAAKAKVKQMYMQGGVPRKAMKQATVVGRDLGGPGVHLYAYLHRGSQMAADFMLEELGKDVSPEMRKRLDYLSQNRDRISAAISQPTKTNVKRKLAMDVGQHTDDQLANIIHGMMH